MPWLVMVLRAGRQGSAALIDLLGHMLAERDA
jgi:hypothetical protein